VSYGLLVAALSIYFCDSRIMITSWLLLLGPMNPYFLWLSHIL